jgi:uncharacterized protein YaaW (UPF0174 family)
MVSSCQIGLEEESEDHSKEMVHRMLKKRIERMISEKMRILSKQKQLVTRNACRLHHFS